MSRNTRWSPSPSPFGIAPGVMTGTSDMRCASMILWRVARPLRRLPRVASIVQSEQLAKIARRTSMKIAIPDLISNSYFPAIAAVELGMFKKEGLDVDLELVVPVEKS